MMHQWWRSLTFVHWDYDPDEVQGLLPDGLTVDTADGRAWVGLVPFVLHVRHDATPFVPWVCRFPETNVRTYVRGPDGRPGIFFLSLDAARLGAVLTARATYSLPYKWAHMRVARRGDRITYESVRRWPERGARSRVVVDVGPPVETDELAHFLTERYVLWSPWRGGFGATVAEHQTWRLRTGTLVDVDAGLLVAGGLPRPTTEPLVHVAEDISVRLPARTPPHAHTTADVTESTVGAVHLPG